SEIVCNDDFCGLQSSVTFAGVAGTTYHVRLSGYNSHAGTYTLNVTYPAPPNNACASATTIGLGTTTGVTLGATADGTATCGLSTASPDVWYNFPADCNATLAMDLCGSDYDTVVSIYTGTCGNLVQVGCNDDGFVCPSNGFASHLEV